MSTEKNYDLEAARKALDAVQLAAAEGCLNRRPAVLAGTRIVVDDEKRKVWFDDVAETMKRLALTQDLVGYFCDVAGVPD